MTRGQIVIVLKGRDKGKLMVVLSSEGEFAQLADGRLRTLDRSKKKKHKHIQITHTVINMIPPCGRDLQDADIRKALTAFTEKEVAHCQRTMS